jgi:hypothetical protein
VTVLLTPALPPIPAVTAAPDSIPALEHAGAVFWGLGFSHALGAIGCLVGEYVAEICYWHSWGNVMRSWGRERNLGELPSSISSQPHVGIGGHFMPLETEVPTRRKRDSTRRKKSMMRFGKKHEEDIMIFKDHGEETRLL